MSNEKAKTINILLYDGNLNGVISIEDTSWNSGELYSAPRESITDLLKTEACNKFGVYLLLSDDMVYIGQSSDLSRRINQHTIGKEWWTSVLIFTTKDDSLTRTDIDYLEYILIEKANSTKGLNCDNKNKGNIPKVDKYRKVGLQQYLDEAMFLMELIGISIFKERKTKTDDSRKGLIDIQDTRAKLHLGKRVKKEAIEYIESKGIHLGKNITYAVKQDIKGEYWANPPVKYLDSDWWIILNNNLNQELIVLKVPARELTIDSNETRRLYLRKDRNAIDLKLDGDTLKEKYSAIDFSYYIVHRVGY